MQPFIQSINPFNNKPIQSYHVHTPEQVNEIITKAQRCFETWKRVPFTEKAVLMKRATQLLKARKEDYALLMAVEMGKPLAEGIAEIEKCAGACEYYADNTEQFLADEPAPADAKKSYVAFRPIGPVLAVMPWNFPFWQVFRFAAPALMAGNVGILKHASNVPGCALEIERIFFDAGFPDGAFSTLLIPGKQVGEVIANPLIKAVTLTGSSDAGRSVAETAGKYLKKTVLELGGSDPYIVLEDADIAHAAQVCAKSRMINNGQSCIAAKRFIVVESQMEHFKKAFIEELKKWKMGDPTNPETTLGPLARTDLRNELHEQVKKSVNKGAEILLGGKIPDGAGAFYTATVLANVKKGMPAYDEELFGPVAALITAKDEKEAIKIANDTTFGLGSAIFTADVAKGERIAKEEINAGSCFVNALVKSDSRLPFGGVNESGYGRELSHFGIREFVNVKTVFVG